ncbi:MAG: hypothetical protein WA317_18600 [Mycobacterium sp.]|uniref:hypothetical protein n=1 Tax=Mycobacterium sp. TaxID=1785 RepID=UPI003CC62E0F
MRSTRRALVVLLATLLSGATVAACVSSSTHDLNSGATVVVRHDSAVLARFALSQLRRLPQVVIATPQSRGAQIQQGPTVRSVLNAAGAAGAERVRVEGRDPAQTLTAAELTEQVILNITKRHTLKLAGTTLDAGRWVRDVSTLVVNP